jgi:hypothetical protein
MTTEFTYGKTDLLCSCVNFVECIHYNWIKHNCVISQNPSYQGKLAKEDVAEV